jgi:hypothetical protein
MSSYKQDPLPSYFRRIRSSHAITVIEPRPGAGEPAAAGKGGAGGAGGRHPRPDPPSQRPEALRRRLPPVVQEPSQQLSDAACRQWSKSP